MSEARLDALEELVTIVRIDHAKMAQSVDHLTKSVNALTDVVQGLRDSMNRGKGSLAMLGIASAFVGGIISWATTIIFR